VRNLPRRTAFDWLKAGWRDLRTNPVPSLLYGLLVFAASIFVIWGMFRYEVDYFFFPTLSGFLVLGSADCRRSLRKEPPTRGGEADTASAT
jgi:uncharacterized membrane protein